jgi:hypothetical protein
VLFIPEEGPVGLQGSSLRQQMASSPLNATNTTGGQNQMPFLLWIGDSNVPGVFGISVALVAFGLSSLFTFLKIEWPKVPLAIMAFWALNFLFLSLMLWNRVIALSLMVSTSLILNLNVWKAALTTIKRHFEDLNLPPVDVFHGEDRFSQLTTPLWIAVFTFVVQGALSWMLLRGVEVEATPKKFDWEFFIWGMFVQALAYLKSDAYSDQFEHWWLFMTSKSWAEVDLAEDKMVRLIGRNGQVPLDTTFWHRVQFFLRSLMSFLANAVMMPMLIFLIPILLAASDNSYEFVKDCFAIVFIPELDNLGSNTNNDIFFAWRYDRSEDLETWQGDMAADEKDQKTMMYEFDDAVVRVGKKNSQHC